MNNECLTPLDVAVECNNEQVIVLLQLNGAVQGDLARKQLFGTKIPRLKSFYDPHKMAFLAQQRLKSLSARKHLADGNDYFGPNYSAPVLNGNRTNGYGYNNKNGGTDYELNMKPADVPAAELVNQNGATLTEHVGMDDANGEEVDAAGEEMEAHMRERLFSNQSLHSATLKDMEDGNTLSTLHERLQQCINMKLELSGYLVCNLSP